MNGKRKCEEGPLPLPLNQVPFFFSHQNGLTYDLLCKSSSTLFLTIQLPKYHFPGSIENILGWDIENRNLFIFKKFMVWAN